MSGDELRNRRNLLEGCREQGRGLGSCERCVFRLRHSNINNLEYVGLVNVGKIGHGKARERSADCAVDND